MDIYISPFTYAHLHYIDCIFERAGISASPSSDEFCRCSLVVGGCHLILKLWLRIYVISRQEGEFIVAQGTDVANLKNHFAVFTSRECLRFQIKVAYIGKPPEMVA